jgi:hypothetical protein
MGRTLGSKMRRRDIGRPAEIRLQASDIQPVAIGNCKWSISNSHSYAITPESLIGKGTVKSVANNVKLPLTPQEP